MITPFARSSRIQRALTLATGQTTSYGSGAGVDDGALQKGVAKSYTILTADQYSGTTNITINSKTDVHSNNCVIDNNTGLMWSRTVSASVGASSNGLLAWTTTGSGATAQGIFAYCAAANAAGLAGYTDWRVPNYFSLISITDYEAANAVPDSTAFPSFPPGNAVWSSTTQPNNTANAMAVGYTSGGSAQAVKTTAYYCILVRG